MRNEKKIWTIYHFIIHDPDQPVHYNSIEKYMIMKLK